MEARALGRTGVRVSELGLGANGVRQRGDPDVDACIAMADRAPDVGINFIERRGRPAGLTTRECDVLALLAVGMANKEIARLGIS